MSTHLDRYLLTSFFDGWASFTPSTESTFIFGRSGEARSVHPEEWEYDKKGVDFVQLVAPEGDGNRDLTSIAAHMSDKTIIPLQLRSSSQLDQFIELQTANKVYVDITGLDYHVWAPILQALQKSSKDVCVVYVEPKSYSFNAAPTDTRIFDLSEEALGGITPLPGFSVLSKRADEQNTMLILFLGFEGHRLAFVLDQIEHSGRIIPVIGVPGFQPEFPFHAYEGNMSSLIQRHRHNLNANVRYAIANSAFSAFYLLEELLEEYPDTPFKIAPIGTKPHGLGVVLFALKHKHKVEIVFDHPRRKPGRTEGIANILVYDVGSTLR